MAPQIYKIEASGKDIQALILAKLGPAVEGEPVSLAVLSMLSLSILLMKPDITVEQLQDCVLSTSSYMITCLAQFDELVEGRGEILH